VAHARVLAGRVERNLIVEGSLRRAILSLAGPAVGSMLLQVTFNIVDMIWVGRLGAPALAALSTGGFLIWSVFAITHMISVGINSMTARYVGAGAPTTTAPIIITSYEARNLGFRSATHDASCDP